jgi:hypothetical protein
MNMARGNAQNFRFYNLNDLKLEVGYTLKNNDKHSFRLAFDYLTNKDDDKSNTFADRVNQQNAYTHDLKASIITFEYTYKLAENTRLRLGYQNGKVEGNNGQQGVSIDDVKTNLYYTEIYSRF